MSFDTGNQIQGIQGLNPGWQFNQTLQVGDDVTVSAGYTNSSQGTFNPNAQVIYQGKVLQQWWTRDNVVDWKLTIRCCVGLVENSLNFVSKPLSANSTDLDAINAIGKQCGIPIVADDGATAALTNYPHSGPQSLSGKPFDLIRTITAQHQGVVFPFVGPNGLNIRTFNIPFPSPAYAYAPVNVKSVNPNSTTQGIVKYTLIGTPQQTQDGVTFRVLLDSSVKIGDIVQIAPGTLINLFAFQPGQTLAPIPSRDGTFAIAGVRHVGDTRGHGGDWYTEITGLSQNFFPNFLLASQPPPSTTIGIPHSQ